MATRIRYRYRRPGKTTQTYDQWLVLDRPDVKVLLMESYSGSELRVQDQVILEHEAPIVWFVFPEKWYDIGRFHLTDGRFTGWYTNLTTPPETDGDTWSAADLFLDLWQPVKGEPVWLDEAEFQQAVKARKLDQATIRRVLNERTLLDLQVKQTLWPPPIARDIDLAQAKSLQHSVP